MTTVLNEKIVLTGVCLALWGNIFSYGQTYSRKTRTNPPKNPSYVEVSLT